MERRLFLTGLLGVAGAAGAAAVLPRQALAAMPMGPQLQPKSVLPDLSAPADEAYEAYEPDELDGQDELGELDEGVQLANHRWNHRRRRIRRWRRRCRWRWVNGHKRWRCRREPYWAFIWFWL